MWKPLSQVVDVQKQGQKSSFAHLITTPISFEFSVVAAPVVFVVVLRRLSLTLAVLVPHSYSVNVLPTDWRTFGGRGTDAGKASTSVSYTNKCFQAVSVRWSRALRSKIISVHFGTSVWKGSSTALPACSWPQSKAGILPTAKHKRNKKISRYSRKKKHEECSKYTY